MKEEIEAIIQSNKSFEEKKKALDQLFSSTGGEIDDRKKRFVGPGIVNEEYVSGFLDRGSLGKKFYTIDQMFPCIMGTFFLRFFP